MTSKSWPIARTLRSAVAAAINEAERTPTLCRMTGPTRAGDKSTTPRYGGHPTSMGNRIRWRAWIGREDLSRGEAHNYSMEVRSDPFESAKSHFFDTGSWGEFCDVTLTLKQAWQARPRWPGKNRRLSVPTGFSALHEPPQPSCIWICISSARQTASCITRT